MHVYECVCAHACVSHLSMYVCVCLSIVCVYDAHGVREEGGKSAQGWRGKGLLVACCLPRNAEQRLNGAGFHQLKWAARELADS